MSVILHGWRSSSLVPHGVSVAVLPAPAVVIVASSVANPSVITTATPHGLATGDTALIASHVGSTPAVDGSRVVTVIDTLSFTVPVNVTVAGTGGTFTRTTAVEPLTLTEAKLIAGQDWAGGDARDALMTRFIAAARSKVEHDTGIALLSQFRDVYYDDLPGDVFNLPAQSTPLQAVVSVKSVDTDAVVNTLAASNYTVDLPSGRISLSEAGVWPTDLRAFQPWTIRVVAGWQSPVLIPPLLVVAVGLLAAHYMTSGRDVVSAEGVERVPYGYDEMVAPFRLMRVA